MQKEIAELKKIPGLHHRCTSLSPPNFNHLPTALLGAMQSYFHNDGTGSLAAERAHQYGTSTNNQRIENFWSHFRKMRSHWWINFSKDMVSLAVVNLDSKLQRECLWFCFYRVLNDYLQKFKEC